MSELKKIKDLPMGSIIRYPENGYDNGSIYVLSNVGRDVKLADGTTDRVFYAVSLRESDFGGYAPGEVNNLNWNDEVYVLENTYDTDD